MFLHDPMTVDTENLTTRELKELVMILREEIETTNDEDQNLRIQLRSFQ